MSYLASASPGSGGQVATRRVSGTNFDSRNRTLLLRQITAPTLVIHGEADTLGLPREAWPEIIDAIAQNAVRRTGSRA